MPEVRLPGLPARVVHVVGRPHRAQAAEPVRCNACRYCFNGKTGRPNTTGIIVYSLVGLLIAVVLLLVLAGIA